MRIEVSHRSRTARAANNLGGCHRAGWCLLVVALWVCGVAGVSAADSSSSDSAPEPAATPVSLAELPPLWEAQRAEIATAQVRFRCFNSSFEVPGNTPERVAQLLAEHDLVARPDALLSFLEALTDRRFEERKPWDDMVLTVSGRRRRVDGGFCTFVSDGDQEAVWTPTNKQLDLQPVGKSGVHHYRLDDLRWIPPQRVSTSAWQYLGTEHEAAVFDVPPLPDGPQFQILTSIDPASGLVMHSITRREAGDPAFEKYQLGLDVHASGIVFPRLRIDLTYAGGIVHSARVMLIQAARFNEPIPEAAFVLPVAGGTRVVDYRANEKDVWIIKSAAADALTLPAPTPAPSAAPITRSSASTASGLRWWLAGVHAAGVTAVVLLVVRRRRAHARSRSPVR